MSLTSAERAYCELVTQKLLNCPLSYAFANPIDPNEEWADAYFKIIKHPMDLSTVSGKLKNGEYATPEAWFSDLSLIWQNAVLFNDKADIIAVIAKFLKEKCEKLYGKMPHKDDELVALKLAKAHKELKKTLAFEMPPFSMVQRVPAEELQYRVEL